MTSVPTNTLRFLVLGIPARMLAVWLAFLLVFWGSHGAARGVPALLAALVCAGVLGWRAARRGSRRQAAVLGAAMLLALAPLAYMLAPLSTSSLRQLPANLEV